MGKAKKFANVFNEQLVNLDVSNLESAISNDKQISALIALINGALEEAKIERELDEYDSILV